MPRRTSTRPLHVAAYDYGMKWNILRGSHGRTAATVRVYPAGTPASELLSTNPDGVFLSNGPAIRRCSTMRSTMRRSLVSGVPVFGICLGHQILGAGDGREDVQTQVRPSRRQSSRQGTADRRSRDHVAESRICRRSEVAARRRRSDAPNLYDGTIEGLRHRRSPSSACSIIPKRRRVRTTRITCSASSWRDGKARSPTPNRHFMPKRTDLKRILVIGSGPIVIGQACEFDYSGTQACKALRDEGLEVVLVNSNPATIMTDPELADRTYVEPLTVDVLEQRDRARAAGRAAADRRRPDRAESRGGTRRAGRACQVRRRS